MFDNIVDIQVVASVAGVILLAYIGLVQYSRYVAHKKKHANDGDDRVTMANTFAVIPYAIIPILFGVGAAFVGVSFADYFAGAGWVTTCAGVALAAVIMTLAAYILMDVGLIKHVGDAVYFDTIESKFRDSVVSDVSEDQIKDALIAYLTKGKV